MVARDGHVGGRSHQQGRYEKRARCGEQTVSSIIQRQRNQSRTYSPGSKDWLVGTWRYFLDVETVAEHDVSRARRRRRYDQKRQEVFATLHTPISTAHAFSRCGLQAVSWTRTWPRHCDDYVLTDISCWSANGNNVRAAL